MQEKLILAYYAQIWKFGPGPQKWNFSKIFHFFEKVSTVQISLPTSPQRSTTPDIKFKSSYAIKRDFGLLYPNMEIRPQAPKNGIIQNFFIFVERSPDFASNEPSTTPRLPKMEFFKKVLFFEKVSRFRFQRALNHPQTLSLSQVMQENMVLAYYAQIWKFGPRLPKIFIFLKRSSNFASNELSTTCRHKVYVKLCKKHFVKKVESRTQLLNPEWRSYQSFT